jgi:hypothetical protein
MAILETSGHDEGVTTGEPYDWADDPELSPEDVRARLGRLPAVPVFTSREEYLLAANSVLRLVGPSSNSTPAPAWVLPATTSSPVRRLLVSPTV